MASLAVLQRAADSAPGKLYAFHFNVVRSIMKNGASFFGHADMSFCFKALFWRMPQDFMAQFRFDLPAFVAAAPALAATAAAPAP